MTLAPVRHHRWVGSSVTRKEDDELLAGTRPFVADIRDGTELHAHVLRSFAPHARIAAVDVTAARGATGVHAVLTAGDLPQPVRRIPLRLWPLDGVDRALQPVLAVDRVRYVGEPVALIVADSRYIAEDAAELIEIDYEFLDPVIGLDHATQSNANQLHDHVDRNVAGTVSIGIGDVDAAMRDSHTVVSGRFRVNRHSGVPIETRGLVAQFDSNVGHLWVWGPTKVVHFNRIALADLLDLDLERIHFIEPAVGGGFGVRGEFYPEDYLIPYASVVLGRRVAWQEDRSESFLATNHSREQLHHAQLAVDADGRIRALSVRAANSMGGYVRSHGATVATMSAIMFPGPYPVQNYSCDIDCVLENKTPTGTYRGPGRFEANFVRERLVDMAARALALTMRASKPAAAPCAPKVGAQGSGWRASSKKVGSGPGSTDAFEILPGSGEVLVFTGLAGVGQGIETSMAQIAADELGVDLARVRVVHGDTDVVPRGLGSFASRGTMLGGGAVYLAARRAASAARRIAASALGVGEGDIYFDGSSYGDGAQSISIEEVASLAGETHISDVGVRPGSLSRGHL